MNERERLIKLLKHEFGTKVSEITADYLLANGVIVLPCNVGDTVWLAEPMYYGYDAPQLAIIEHFNIYRKGITVTVYIDPDTYKEVDLEDIFLTREAAKQALKKKGRANG